MEDIQELHIDEVMFPEINDKFQWFLASHRQGKKEEIQYPNPHNHDCASPLLEMMASQNLPNNLAETNLENKNHNHFGMTRNISEHHPPRRTYANITRHTNYRIHGQGNSPIGLPF